MKDKQCPMLLRKLLIHVYQVHSTAPTLFSVSLTVLGPHNCKCLALGWVISYHVVLISIKANLFLDCLAAHQDPLKPRFLKQIFLLKHFLKLKGGNFWSLISEQVPESNWKRLGWIYETRMAASLDKIWDRKRNKNQQILGNSLVIIFAGIQMYFNCGN